MRPGPRLTFHLFVQAAPLPKVLEERLSHRSETFSVRCVTGQVELGDSWQLPEGVGELAVGDQEPGFTCEYWSKPLALAYTVRHKAGPYRFWAFLVSVKSVSMQSWPHRFSCFPVHVN